MLIQGEIIYQSYWDFVAEEINDKLQECSQIALAELVARLHFISETVTSILEPRLGTMVKGRLEDGQLYTPEYVARVRSMVQDVVLGITVLINFMVLGNTLQKLLQEMDGASGVAVEPSFFQSMFNVLLEEGKILKTLRAGTHWTPTIGICYNSKGMCGFFLFTAML